MNGVISRSALAAREVKPGQIHIYLSGLPRTALPADVWRLLRRADVSTVQKVELEYSRFIPTGRALLTVNSPMHTKAAVKSLDRANLSGLPIQVTPSDPPSTTEFRIRGSRGLAQAAERGILVGDGPSGQLHQTMSGKNVVMWGLPGQITPEGLKQYLADYTLADGGGGKDVLRIDIPGVPRMARRSKLLVRLASVSEAHRLVRNMHMTYFDPAVFGEEHLIKARAVY